MADNDGDPLAVPAGTPVTLSALQANATFMQRRAAFDELIAMVPFKVGKLVSCEAREARGIPEDQFHPLVYGETEFDTIALALAKIQRDYKYSLTDKSFYDIGCGTGKPVYAAALLHSGWKRCVGVEVLDDLVRVAEGELRTQWEDGMPFLPSRGSKVTQYKIPASCRRTPIRFLIGDATTPSTLVDVNGDPPGQDEAEAEEMEPGWGVDADVVYVCATCFDEATMAGLRRVAAAMKPGSFFFSSGCSIVEAAGEGGAGGSGEGPSSGQQQGSGGGWELLEEQECAFSWGAGTLFICRKAGAAADGS